MRHNLSWAAALAAAAAVVPSTVTGPWAIPVALVAGTASYLAGRRLSALRPSLLAFAAAAAANAAIAAAGSFFAFAITALVSIFLVCVIPWWAGRHRRLRHEQAARERALLTAQAQLRERGRIAADMHDLLGHDLALLSLSAGALELTADSPATAQAAAEVRRRAADATQKLHSIVGVLGDSAPSVIPAGEPLEDLVARARQAGMGVTFTHLMPDAGTPPLSPIAAHAVRRVVQESLTNAAKHGGGSAVRILLDETTPTAVVAVTNKVAAAARSQAAGTGQGLPGLEELVRISGGTFEAGAGPARGDGPGTGGSVFTVEARIPRQAEAVRQEVPGAPALGVGALPEPGTSPGSGAPPATDTVETLRRGGRRQLLRNAALPLALAVLLLAVFIGLQAATVSMTALAPANYAQLAPGQSRAEIARLLPGSSIDRPSPMLEVPPALPGSSCEFFQARSGVLDFSADMYRLCFRNNILVSLDHLQG